MNMVDRIRALCRAQGTSVTKLEESLGFGNGTIGKWKNAKNAPPADKLQKVADALGVSADFLLTGKERPANKLTDPSPELVADVIKKLAVTITEKEKPTGNSDGLDYSDMELLEAFQRADDSTREAIRLLLKLK